MEIIALIRGEQAHQKEWIDLLRSAFWPHKAKDREGKHHNIFSRTGVSPITPVSITFPEKSLPYVLGMIRPEGNKPDHILDKTPKTKFLKKQLQKALNLKKLPKSWKEYKHPITEFMKIQKVNAHIIGIKEDTKDKDGIEMI